MVSLAALITPCCTNAFPNTLPANIPNIKNPPFCSFTLFLVFPLTLYISNPDSSSDLTIFIIFFISSFEIIVVVGKGESEGRHLIHIFFNSCICYSQSC